MQERSSSAAFVWISFRKLIVFLFWLGAFAALVVMARTGQAGWDANVCSNTINILRSGGDPYAQGNAAALRFDDEMRTGVLQEDPPSQRQPQRPPLLFVYPPLVLWFMRHLALVPGWLLAASYWSAIAVGVALQLWASYQLASVNERRWLMPLLPLALFFPGLMVDDAILSGNIAYVLYGAVLAALVAGWKRGEWKWFYVAVFAASLFKTPYLYLLALPLLLSAGQWVNTTATGMAGIAVFAVQRWVWPQQFAEYMRGLSLMFTVSHDFGAGPAGVLSRYLAEHGTTNLRVLALGHFAFATLVMLLIHSSRKRGEANFETWVPVALVATFLLNPRIMVYDMFPVTIAMALLLSRAFTRAWQGLGERFAPANFLSPRVPIIVAAALFGAVNVVSAIGPQWGIVEVSALMLVLGAALWLVWTEPEITAEEGDEALVMEEVGLPGTIEG